LRAILSTVLPVLPPGGFSLSSVRAWRELGDPAAIQQDLEHITRQRLRAPVIFAALLAMAPLCVPSDNHRTRIDQLVGQAPDFPHAGPAETGCEPKEDSQA
jgi:hypothetical protein